MHRSRLTTVVIDCSAADYEAGQAFWSAAFAKPPVARNERFAVLRGRVGGESGVYVGLQRLSEGPPAIHLDIETDDVPAEVARLEQLGARVKARIRNHVVMTAPSGHAFCVVPVLRGDFPAGATEWPNA
jgi:glyoxalase superfamily protein